MPSDNKMQFMREQFFVRVWSSSRKGKHWNGQPKPKNPSVICDSSTKLKRLLFANGREWRLNANPDMKIWHRVKVDPYNLSMDLTVAIMKYSKMWTGFTFDAISSDAGAVPLR